jgi:hypothetical protein
VKGNRRCGRDLDRSTRKVSNSILSSVLWPPTMARQRRQRLWRDRCLPPHRAWGVECHPRTAHEGLDPTLAEGPEPRAGSGEDMAEPRRATRLTERHARCSGLVLRILGVISNLGSRW